MVTMEEERCESIAPREHCELTVSREHCESTAPIEHECFKDMIRVKCAKCDNQYNLKLRHERMRNGLSLNLGSWTLLGLTAALIIYHWY